MSDFLQGWKRFLNENKQLDEIKEEELSDIEEVLHNLDPTDLSFNNLFGDKMRLVIPLKEKDPLKYPLKHITKAEKDKIELEVVKSLQLVEEEVNSMPFATIN